MGMFDSLKRGLARSREALAEVFYMGGEVDEDFWEDLEDRLVMGDMGAEVAMQVTDDLREQAAREGLKSARQLRDALAKRLAAEFAKAECDPFEDVPSCVLFVGINGAGKTTTVGKLAGVAKAEGKSCLIGGADTFRAAAIEQLEVWGQRSGVEVVTRERGVDPASVCYDVLDRAEKDDTQLVLIDTAGRLHTSPELMRELERVILLRVVDEYWMDHIDAMAELRKGIGLRGYGNVNPVDAYRQEGFDMFETMIAGIRQEVVRRMYLVRVRKEQGVERKSVVKNPVTNVGGDVSLKKQPVKREKKPGRNDPCPCGKLRPNGLPMKYKDCCGRNA